MPIEVDLLRDKELPISVCPNPICKASFVPFMRGHIQRSKRLLYIGPTRDYCAVICGTCRHIVGWESP